MTRSAPMSEAIMKGRVVRLLIYCKPLWFYNYFCIYYIYSQKAFFVINLF